MSEKIYIHGVDVSGCEFYVEDNGIIAPDGTPERTNICTSPELHCKNNDNCFCNKQCSYKQLKRLKQENEKYMHEKIKEYLEDVDYIAQFDGTPYDLSVEIKQIISKWRKNEVK